MGLRRSSCALILLHCAALGCEGAPPSPPGLQISPASIDFGQVSLDGAARVDLELFNESARTVRLQSIEPSQTLKEELRVDGAPAALLPGQRAMVAVVLTPLAIGGRSGELLLQSDAPMEPERRIPVMAQVVRSGLLASPEAVDFGAVRFGETRTSTIELRNPGDQRIGVRVVALGPSTSPEFSSSPVGGFALDSGDRMSLLLRYTPTDVGFDVGRLIVVDDTERPNPLSVQVIGEGVADDLSISPSTLLFEGVLVGEQKTRSLRVINRGPREERIDAARLTPKSGGAHQPFSLLSPIPLSVPPGEELALQVRYAPTLQGLDLFSLELESMGLLEPAVIELRGEATLEPEPALSLSAQALDFGQTQRGATSLRELILDNLGHAPLSFSLELSGPPFFIETALPLNTTLAPLERAVVRLRFSPVALGKAKGQLQLRSESAGAERTLLLSGEGQEAPAPNLWASPAALELPGTSSAAASLRLMNAGTATAAVQLMLPRGPFQLRAGLTQLAPGESRRISIGFSSADLERWQGELLILTPDQQLAVPVDAQRRPAPPLVPALEVRLSWQEESNLDLHMIQEGGLFLDARSDCCYCNPSPNWGDLMRLDDDPALLEDALEGPAVERLLHWRAPRGRYRVEVHNAGDGQAQAELRIISLGELVASVRRALPAGARWSAGSIIVETAGGRFEPLELPLDQPLALGCF